MCVKKTVSLEDILTLTLYNLYIKDNDTVRQHKNTVPLFPHFSYDNRIKIK